MNNDHLPERLSSPTCSLHRTFGSTSFLVGQQWLATLGSALALCGCWASPTEMVKMPRALGAIQVVHAPARQIVKEVPAALEAAGMELNKTVTSGPERWTFIAVVPFGLTGNGQWIRLIVEDAGAERSTVSAFAISRAGGLAENPYSTARNIILNLLILCEQETQVEGLRHAKASALQPEGGQL